MVGLNGLDLKGSQHGMTMSPGLWMGLMVCVFGLTYELASPGGGRQAGENSTLSDSVPARFHRDGDDESVQRSARPREVTVRKVRFPFQDVGIGGLNFNSVEPKNRAERFLLANPEALSAYRNFEEAGLGYGQLRVAGLGEKHPDVIAKYEAVGVSRGQLDMMWAASLAGDSDSGRDRMRRRRP